MPREADTNGIASGSNPPLPEGPDLESGAHAANDGPENHQRSHSEERSPLIRQEAEASTSGAAPQTAGVGATDVQPEGSDTATPPEAEGAVETVDGDLVRASAARQMCRKNKSPLA